MVLGKLQRKSKKVAGDVTEAVEDVPPPSPNPMTNLIIADVALRSGGQLLRHAVERALLGRKYSPQQARNIVKGRNMAQTLFGTAIARIATRSVPGALVVGGGLLAKSLYDRRHKRKAAEQGEAQVAKQIAEGANKDAAAKT